MDNTENKENVLEEITMLDNVEVSSDDKNKEMVDKAENEFEQTSAFELREEQEVSLKVSSEDQKTDVITECLQELTSKIDHMNTLFVQKIAYTAHEEKIVDKMHAELQKYKQDMYSQLVRPILLDIIEMRESILRMSSNFAARPEGEQDIPLKTFSDYAFDAQEILEKNNISIYKSKEGDDFIAIKQKVIKKIITPLEELHGKIAESLSNGYEYLGKTISPEKVGVYVYQKSENKNKEGDTNNG